MKGFAMAVGLIAMCLVAALPLSAYAAPAKTPACTSADTFVFVPPNVKAADLENYLKANAPKPAILQRCNLSPDEWLAGALREHRKGK